MPKVDVGSDLPKLEKRVDALDKEAKKIGSAHKKKSAEFETLNGALWEGKDVIDETKKRLKKEKDAKKIKALAGEIEDQETTFEKISKKIPPVRKELEGMGNTAGNMLKELKAAKDDIAALSKALNRTGGDVKDLKAWAKQLKDLDDTLDKDLEIAHIIADAGLPNTPKL